MQRELPKLPRGTVAILNVSGRGDKDVETVRAILEERDRAMVGGVA
jgi:tryptophan synthase beta subunit